MFLSPTDITHLYGGLTDGQNGGKLCANHGCVISKHSKNLTGALLPMNAYLTLPGSSLVHPLPIFSYRGFSPDTIKDLKSTSLTYNEVSNVRFLYNTTSKNKLDNEVKTLLLTPTENALIPPESEPSQKNILTPTKIPPPTSRHAPCPTATPPPTPFNSPCLTAMPPRKVLLTQPLPPRHQVTHYGFQRDRQLRLQISHKMTEVFPTDTQDYIKSFFMKLLP